MSPRHTPAIPPPTLLANWRVWAVIMAAMLIPFFLPIPLVLRRDPVLSPLGDNLHVILLAGVTLMLYWRGRLRGRLVWSAVAAAFIGAAIEIIQIPCGRNANVLDFLTDLVGINLVVGYVLWRGHGRASGRLLFIALLLIVPIRLHKMPFVAAASYRIRGTFPLIADLEDPGDHWLWSANGDDAQVQVVAVDDSPDGPGHVVRLSAGPPAPWPGAEMRRFPHDWSAHTELLLDVRLVPTTASADSTQRFTIRCDDFRGRKTNTWIYNVNTATTAWQTFRIPIADRRVTDGSLLKDRLFDRRDADRILIYFPHPKHDAVLEIDNLRLR